jgi:60 kDa SS-A/Ro ribonucleoprotein
MNDALEMIRTRGAATPQRDQADARQARNWAGGYAFTVPGETRIRRFLTLGSEGTYYATQRQVTTDNAPVLLDWARNRAPGLVALATEISVAGRAPRNQPALLAIAAAGALGDVAGRRAAAKALPLVARTGTHLYTWAKYREQFGGWGPLTRRAAASWYLGKDPDDLAYQLVKYRQRDGWSHADVLRLAHPKPRHAGGALMEMHDRLFGWVTSGVVPDELLPRVISAYLRARDIQRGDARPAVKAAAYAALVRDNPGLPWEALPDEATSQAEVWRALIDTGLPMTALLRNLPKLTRLGVLAPMSVHLAKICAQLRDSERLRKARVHPVAILVAVKTYASGRSEKGDSTWIPVPQVIDAMNDAFYLAFGAVEAAGKRTSINLDISGSMGTSAAGYCISAREVTAAMSLVVMATEPAWAVHGFSHSYIPLQISPRMRLDDVVRAIRGLPFGATDCALPMVWALKNRVEVDTFQVWTDGETWFGGIHPHQALDAYRQAMGIPARLQVIATTPTGFSIAEPDDLGQLDVSGFDSDVPNLLADHSAGRL